MPLAIIRYPHPILRYKTKPINKINQNIRDIVEEMFELMYTADGVGLAASQVGLPYRLCVLNISGKRGNTEDEFVLINPVIKRRKGRIEDTEGCLSFPDIHVPVIRSTEIEIESIALSGVSQNLKWKAFPARAAQHEIDHLNGVTMIDRLNETELLTISDELDAMETEFNSNRRLGFIPTDEEIMKQLEKLETEQR
ncbi:MAG: peptide deformylase [Planctomycetaceae bacterium]|jgi:peptide deformylase|nr:peptide deformylase [Planctomycetaceae bacterium]